jgi:hypothetical protein
MPVATQIDNVDPPVTSWHALAHVIAAQIFFLAAVPGQLMAPLDFNPRAIEARPALHRGRGDDHPGD